MILMDHPGNLMGMIEGPEEMAGVGRNLMTGSTAEDSLINTVWMRRVMVILETVGV
jgi:hypothetical protein